MRHSQEKLRRSQIEAVLEFLPVFEQPDFKAAELVFPVRGMAYYTYSPDVKRFQRAIEPLLFPFDWPSWRRSYERYRNPSHLRTARLLTLRKLLTCYSRAERFCEGTWAGGFRDGHVVAILRRLKELYAGDKSRTWAGDFL
jgi:hypothetical protein